MTQAIEDKLAAAINFEDHNLVASLLDAGACIKKETFNAFHLANQTGNTGIVKLIAETQSQIDELIASIKKADREQATELVERYPYILTRIEDVHGLDWTPLMYAAESGDGVLVRLFLEKGASPHSSFHASSMNALTIAAYHEHEDIVRLLKEFGVESSDVTNCIYASLKGDLKKVRSYIERGMDVNAKDPCEHCALAHAFHSGNKELVDYLLAEGADVNRANGWGGWIWFQGFIKNGNLDTVRQVLELGYDVNHQDEWGNTCLKYARESGQTVMEELLIEFGAKA